MDGKLFFFRKYLILVMLLLGLIDGYKSCNEIERKALLELKKYLIKKSDYDYEYLLLSWINDAKSDCCLWKGLECNPTSSRVIGISFGEMEFREPCLLNLSLLHPFEELRSLNLSADGSYSFIGFFDDILGYKSLRKLTNLEILDLSSNNFNKSIFPFLNAATSLTTLFLHNNYMGGPFPSKELKDLRNLELLDLSGNILNGSVSAELSHLKKLKALDLSNNRFSSSMELQELRNLSSLEVLSLARNYMDGPIPIEVVCEMHNLRELDLSENSFVGQLPLCLSSLNKLQVLDLSYNQLSGNLPSSFSSLESLEYLSLSENNFTSLFSLSPLTNLTKLKVFKLSSTSGTVQVEEESSWQPKFQLSVIVLRLCSLEKIPFFLLYQKSLRLVDLSSNFLSGTIPTWLLANNPELEVLQLQNNLLTAFHMPTPMVHNLQILDFSANNIGGLFLDNIGRAFPNLLHMNGSDNALQGNFPSSMGEMKKISFLDFSYNNFSGKLPRNFLTGCPSLKFLKLSYNRFSGHFLPGETSFSSLKGLRIDNNLFSGKIGIGLLNSTRLFILDMSNNCLTGAIPSWLSKLNRLGLLLISENFLEGTVPPSLLLISFLDLSGNLLSGALPNNHRMSTSVLILHNNNFTGLIPDTLLESLQVLDLRNNKLSGSIPEFFYSDNIGILVLRGNHLTGSIPRKLCDLRSIKVLDLSDNKLNGSIPSCLYNLSTGLGGETIEIAYPSGFSVAGLQMEFYKSTFVVEKLEASYINFHAVEIKFAVKKRYDLYSGTSEFSHGILDSLYGIDLSNNQLSGIIPADLGDLSRLQVLNLSRNFLSSSVPSSFSNLKDIESLDLSYNMLQGSIPNQLNSLTSLAVFNVSYNNLSGVIPRGKQFNTFDEKSYLGNPLLCGQPTIRSCEPKKSSEEAYHGGEEEEDDDASIDMLVFYFTTASTYVAVLIGILVLMCFDCPWRRVWLHMIDAFIASAKSRLP